MKDKIIKSKNSRKTKILNVSSCEVKLETLDPFKILIIPENSEGAWTVYKEFAFPTHNRYI